MELAKFGGETGIRALAEELNSQREAIAASAERARKDLAESQSGLLFDLDMLSRRLAGAIVETGGALTRSLEMASKTLDNGLVERGQGLVARLDQRAEDLLSAFDAAAGRFDAAADSRSKLITQNFEGRTRDLTVVLEDGLGAITNAFDARTTQISQVIDVKSSHLIASMTDHADHVSNNVNLLDSLLTDKLKNFGFSVQKETNQIVDILDRRARHYTESGELLYSRVLEAEALAAQHISQIETAITDRSAGLRDVVEAGVRQISESVGNGYGRFAEALELQSEKLGGALEKYNSGFSARADLLEIVLDEKTNNLGELSSRRSKEISETLGGHAKSFAVTIAEHTRVLSETLEQHGSFITQELEQRTKTLDEALRKRSGEIAEGLRSNGSELENALLARTRDLELTIAMRTAELDQSLAIRSQEMDQSVSQRLREMDQGMGRHAHSFDTTLSMHSETLGSLIAGHTAALGETVAQSVLGMEQRLTIASSDIERAAFEAERLLDGSLASHAHKLAAVVSERGDALARAVDAQTTTASGIISEGLRRTTSALGDHFETVATQIELGVAKVGQSLNDGVSGSMARLVQAQNDAAERIEAALGGTREDLEQAATDLEAWTNSARHTMDEVMERQLAALPEAIVARVDIAAERLAGLSATIDSSLTTSMHNLERGADKIEDIVAKHLLTATRGAAEEFEKAAERAGGSIGLSLQRLGALTEDIDKLVAVRLPQATDQVSNHVQGMGNLVTQQAEVIKTIMDARTEQLDTSLRNHSNVLGKALSQHAGQAERLMSSATSRMMSDITGAMMQLSATRLERSVDQSDTSADIT